MILKDWRLKKPPFLLEMPFLMRSFVNWMSRCFQKSYFLREINNIHSIMHKKLFYEAPDAEVLVIRYEEAFLQGPSNQQIEGGYPGDSDEYDHQGDH